MTIEEYQKKYVRIENFQGITSLAKILISFAIIVLAYIFVSICYKMFSINILLGILSIIISIVIIVYCFIIPIWKIVKIGVFETNLSKINIIDAKSHNEKICKQIAKGIIDINTNVEKCDWYKDDENIIKELKIALADNDTDFLRENLSLMMNNSIRKSSNNIIVRNAIESGKYTALSQMGLLDMFVTLIFNIQMIKNLIFLYGFRPSTIELFNICKTIFLAAAAASGLQNSKAGKNIFNKILYMIKKSGPVASLGAGAAAGALVNPVVGTLVATLTGAAEIVFDSTIQGLANGTFTAFIGYKTIEYLNKEYKLQEILDNIDLLDDKNEFKETFTEIEDGLKKQQKKEKE